MLFIYLYHGHGDLYSDLWKSNLYLRPTAGETLLIVIQAP